MIRRAPSPAARIASAGLALALLALPGCRANYAADVRNQTAQPVYADVFTLVSDGLGKSPVRKASVRLGPGDRKALGPVRASSGKGRVYLLVDTPANPGRPITMDLQPGVTVVEVQQQGDISSAPIRLVEVP